jgi:hypothetical protein
VPFTPIIGVSMQDFDQCPCLKPSNYKSQVDAAGFEKGIDRDLEPALEEHSWNYLPGS